MDSGASLSEFSPLVDVLENAPVGGGVSGGVSGLGKDGENSGEISNGAFRESRKNTHLANDKDEDEDGEDEVFNPEKENIIESQERTERKRTISGTGGRSIKFPCGVCGLGVGTAGIMCGACCLWIHNGKTRKCAGLEGKDDTNADTFRCTKCVESDRIINVHLRK